MRTSAVRRTIRAVLALVLAAGVVCQFVQTTDPKPALSYFTVDGAILTAVLSSLSVALLGTPREVRIRMLWATASTGVVFSGLVYATVIAPSTPTGTWFQPWDDAWVRASTVLLHAVAPVLVLGDRLLEPHRDPRPWRTAAIGVLWPSTYLVVLLATWTVGGPAVPYDFLLADTVPGGWPTVVAAGAGTAVVFFLVGRALLALSARSPLSQDPIWPPASS